MKRIITIFALSSLMVTQMFGQPNVSFKFRSTAPDNTLRRMEQNAKAVFEEINNASRDNRKPQFSTANMTSDGIDHTLKLWNISKFRCVEPAYIENVSTNSYGGYQVRNIATFFTDANKSQDLVIDFNRAGEVSNISIAISKTQYNAIMKTGEVVKDERERWIILNFVENFRTAYERQDLDYIKTVFNDDALIITGTKLIVKTGDGKYASRTKYTTQNKEQYINKLRTAIMAKDKYGNKLNKLTIEFERISIIKSEKDGDDKLYLVRLWQNWDSKGKNNFHDEGWLTLVIDLSKEGEPIIWVRAWQGANQENKLYNFGCFYNPSSCE
ncbi:MAG: hypothetical protein FWH18_02485 [Marinilabiliaceae bacterium]|nr:hypothetical protein [Marinilabiliaceae bacterium]